MAKSPLDQSAARKALALYAIGRDDLEDFRGADGADDAGRD